MNNVYLYVIELIRNQLLFSILFVGLFCLAPFALMGRLDDVFNKKYTKIVSILFTGMVSVFILVFVSFSQGKIEPYTCLKTVENFRGTDPSDYLIEEENNLKNHRISIQLAKKINANNYDELVKQEISIQDRIVFLKTRLEAYKRYPVITEFMVLAQLGKTYTIISENKQVQTNFKLELKTSSSENDYILNESCSLKITNIAQNQGYIVQR